ncbi:MAG TPA: hypothetical protein VJP06_02520 [Thermoplasmata archaeon]|nr:hypothetical protein [Thermoplasmata archaeon]
MSMLLALPQRLSWLRRLIIAQLVFIAVQYEVGTSLSISGAFPDVPATGFSIGAISNYMGAGGPALVIHAILGIVIFADALLVLIIAFPVKIRWFRILAVAAFAFVLSAGLGGLQFLLSGFHDDNSSYQMSTGFLLAFVFTFLAFYFLGRPASPAHSGPPAPPSTS